MIPKALVCKCQVFAWEKKERNGVGRKKGRCRIFYSGFSKVLVDDIGGFFYVSPVTKFWELFQTSNSIFARIGLKILQRDVLFNIYILVFVLCLIYF